MASLLYDHVTAGRPFFGYFYHRRHVIIDPITSCVKSPMIIISATGQWFLRDEVTLTDLVKTTLCPDFLMSLLSFYKKNNYQLL